MFLKTSNTNKTSTVARYDANNLEEIITIAIKHNKYLRDFSRQYVRELIKNMIHTLLIEQNTYISTIGVTCLVSDRYEEDGKEVLDIDILFHHAHPNNCISLVEMYPTSGYAERNLGTSYYDS